MVAKPAIEQSSAREEHRPAMIKIMKKVNDEAGILVVPTMTTQELRRRQRASGIRPEDNGASRELMRMH